MTAVSHGKPYAGNPHVRFEEGDSASAEPRRKSLLHKKWFGIGLLVSFLLTVWWLNTCYSFCSDDCHYGLWPMAGADGIRPHLGTLAHAWIADCWAKYRPVVHFFVRVFTGCLSKSVFNVCNTLMAGFLLVCINRLSTGGWRLDWARLPVAMFLVFFILFKGESYLWCAGSLNYLWAGTWALGFCIVVERLNALGRLPWWQGWLLVPIVLLIGWSQEAFTLPIGFGLFMGLMLRQYRLDARKVLLYGAYTVGAFLLVVVAGERALSETGGGACHPFCLSSFLVNMVKVAVAIKGVWLLLAALVFVSEKKSFIKRHAFYFWVIFGSVIMILVAGFNGERSLWCANLMSIILLVKMLPNRPWLSYGCGVTVLALLPVLAVLGSQIRANFEIFARQFETSDAGVACHQRVDCGPFARFFHQVIYQWANGFHGFAFAEYHGKKGDPIALPRELYENLYVQDRFCICKNKIPIPGEFYTTPTVNTIVMPFAGTVVPTASEVSYAASVGFVAKIKREMAARTYPPIAVVGRPRLLKTSHGDYLLIAKDFGSDGGILGVSVR